MVGRIKSIATDRETGKRKGFGFIQPEISGPEVFFHRTSLVGSDFEDCNVGDHVTYDPGNGSKGPRAENVRVT